MSRGRGRAGNAGAKPARRRAGRVFEERPEVHSLPVSRIATSKGLEVDLAYDWDVNDGIAEGWTVHRVRAVVDGVEAGYLKISYVPSKLAARYFPDPFHYALWQTGSYYAVRRMLEEKPESEWDDEEVRRAIESGRGWMNPEQQRELDVLEGKELRTAWAEVKKYINRRHRRDWEEFLEFHLDRPLVDYIRVHRGEDRWKEADGVLHLDRSDPGFQRQGVGTALYEVGAKWMAANGLKLWASGLQSSEAQSAWESLAAKHQVTIVEPTMVAGRLKKERRYLDGELIQLDELPEPAAV